MTDRDIRRGEGPTTRQLAYWTVVGTAIAGGIVISSLRCDLALELPGAYEARALPPEPAPRLVDTPEPDSDYYPCSDCHEDEPTDRTVRDLEFEHEDVELVHGDLWCLHCHQADDRDFLHLADGNPVAFEESWRVCTQCHGEKLPDWRAGVHGQRVGHWWGPKSYEPCVTCHAPHAPRFAPLAPHPAPIETERIVWRAESGATGKDQEE